MKLVKANHKTLHAQVESGCDITKNGDAFGMMIRSKRFVLKHCDFVTKKLRIKPVRVGKEPWGFRFYCKDTGINVYLSGSIGETVEKFIRCEDESEQYILRIRHRKLFVWCGRDKNTLGKVITVPDYGDQYGVDGIDITTPSFESLSKQVLIHHLNVEIAALKRRILDSEFVGGGKNKWETKDPYFELITQYNFYKSEYEPVFPAHCSYFSKDPRAMFMRMCYDNLLRAKMRVMCAHPSNFLKRKIVTDSKGCPYEPVAGVPCYRVDLDKRQVKQVRKGFGLVFPQYANKTSIPIWMQKYVLDVARAGRHISLFRAQKRWYFLPTSEYDDRYNPVHKLNEGAAFPSSVYISGISQDENERLSVECKLQFAGYLPATYWTHLKSRGGG